MNRVRVLLEVRQMRFAEVYESWRVGRMTQEEAAEALGVSDRTSAGSAGASRTTGWTG